MDHQLFSHSRFKDKGIHFPIFVAPMVGLSHVAFRELVRHYTPTIQQPILHTEMLSTRRLPSERLGSCLELKVAPEERNFIPQLLGNEERFIAPSVKRLSELQPTAFDINMGCPASHVLKHNWGVRLTGDAKYAEEVVRITKSCSNVPVSVKFRGSAKDQVQLDDLISFTDHIEKGGADWITMHPRPKENQHSGPANWDLISKVRKHRSLPVIANGDIQVVDDIVKLFRDFQVDGVMIARSATVRPWMVWQLCHQLGLTELKPPMTLEEESKEYFRACLKFLELLEIYCDSEIQAVERFRFFAATGIRWFKFGHSFWKMSSKAKTVEALRNEILYFAENYDFPISGRIEL